MTNESSSNVAAAQLVEREEQALLALLPGFDAEQVGGAAVEATTTQDLLVQREEAAVLEAQDLGGKALQKLQKRARPNRQIVQPVTQTAGTPEAVQALVAHEPEPIPDPQAVDDEEEPVVSDTSADTDLRALTALLGDPDAVPAAPAEQVGGAAVEATTTQDLLVQREEAAVLEAQDLGGKALQKLQKRARPNRQIVQPVTQTAGTPEAVQALVAHEPEPIPDPQAVDDEEEPVVSDTSADTDLRALTALLGDPDAEPVEPAVEAVLVTITPTQVEEQSKKLLGFLKDVPKQTMLLSLAKPLAKVALGMLIKKEIKSVTATTLTHILGSGSLAVPGASALVAAGADAIRLHRGGVAAMYESAAQHTLSTMTTVRGKELKGSESQKEFEKNRIEKKRSIPIKLIRKIGTAMNALRSATTQVAFRITAERSDISKKLNSIDANSVGQISDKVKEAYTAGKLSKYDILELGHKLARLRSMGFYGDIDVYGAEGSGWNKVDKRHTPELMAQLHNSLNEMIQRGELNNFNENDKKRWDQEYSDVDRKKKDRMRKGFAVAGSALATFFTASGVSLLVEKISEIDFGKLATDFKGLVRDTFDSNEIKSTNAIIPEVDATGVEVDETIIPDTDDADVDVETAVTPDADDTDSVVGATDTPDTDDADVEVEATDAPDAADTEAEVEQAAVVEQVAELRDLGNDKVPWDAIMHSIQNNSRIDVDNLNGTTNVIKNLYRALNANTEMGVIGLDSTFAIPYELGGELPEGAVGWFFSEDQIENLAPQIDEAINAFNRGEELTEIQELMINLNSSNEVVAKTIDELSDNPELFQQFMDIANEG